MKIIGYILVAKKVDDRGRLLLTEFAVKLYILEVFLLVLRGEVL